MPRLFLALDLPADIRSELSRLPPVADGLRYVQHDQLHLTLHFLGERDVRPVIDALQPATFAPFSLALASVGEFRQRSGAIILWAGVNMTPELRRLHADLATRLQTTIGYVPETRLYTPHITLARGRAETPKSAVVEYLSRHSDWRTREFPVAEFRLMSSQLTPAGSIYRCEHVFSQT